MNPQYKFLLGITGEMFTGEEDDARENTFMDVNGVFQPISGFFTTGKIYIPNGIEELVTTVSTSTAFFLCIFNAQDEFLTGVKIESSYRLHVPPNASYCRFSADYLNEGKINLYGGVFCTPIYGDDVTMDHEQESGEKFFRKKLNGKLTFIRDTFDLIMAQPFDTQYNLTIEAIDGDTQIRYYDGVFYQTDCEINLNDKSLQVQPETLDEYTAVLAGYEKEFNLIELAPAIERLTIRKRPLVQVYRPGDDVVSCFLGGMYWEQDVINAIDNEADLKIKYYFSQVARLVSIEVTAKDGAPSSYAGTYVGKVVDGDSTLGIIEQGTFYNFQHTYKIEYTKYNADTQLGQEWYAFKDVNGNQLYFEFDTKSIESKTVTLEKEGTATGSLQCDIILTPIFMRYLCDVEKVGTVETYKLPTDDIVENNRNYKRVVGFAVDLTDISAGKSDEPTEWGRMDDGSYFLPPASSTGQPYFPIAQSYWGNSSFWYKYYLADWVLEQKAQKEYTLKDTYPLYSCIEVLLKKIAPSISHKGTSEYSQFFYSSNNPISGLSFTMLISPKSNLLNGEYQTPAQKAPTTLKQILDMLKNCFKCYWYIEDGKLKIEHVKFFRNGGSYYKSQSVALDLTKLEYTRSGKKWAFATSQYSFDKIDMPQQYQFAWMDEVTTPFEGFPIEIRSKYVTAGKIEEVNVSNFTSDVDFMLLNPNSISQDGFAVFAAVKPAGGGQYELPFIQFSVDNISYHLQNGYMSFANLQPTYWLHDMPAKLITVNKMQTSSESIERKKKQQLNVPVPIDINPMQLINTYLGGGVIDKLSVNLCSLTSKTTLKYDTE